MQSTVRKLIIFGIAKFTVPLYLITKHFNNLSQRERWYLLQTVIPR